MSTSAGVDFTLAYGDGLNRTGDLPTLTHPPVWGALPTMAPTPASGVPQRLQGNYVTQRRYETGHAIAATQRAAPGGDYFNRILVRIAGSPFGRWAFLPLGNLLSTTLRDVEVWNAFLDTTETLTSISVLGETGVTIIDPFGLPADFLALRSRTYQADISSDGAPTINDFLTFDFGLDTHDNAPIGLVTGLRLVPFLFEPDWSLGLVEGREYLTDVFSAGTQAEQRRALRAYPRRYIEYTTKTFTTQEAAYLQTLLYGWIAHKYGVLAWYDLMKLTSNANPGDTVINVDDTTQRDLVAGQIVILRTDPFTYEARVVASFTSTSITFVDQLINAWPAATTRAFPTYVGALDPQQPTSRYHAAAGESHVAFLCDPVVPT